MVKRWWYYFLAKGIGFGLKCGWGVILTVIYICGLAFFAWGCLCRWGHFWWHWVVSDFVFCDVGSVSGRLLLKFGIKSVPWYVFLRFFRAVDSHKRIVNMDKETRDASLSEVYSAVKLQWHFTCGFDFRYGLWLPFVAAFAVLRVLLIVPAGSMGPL